MQHIQAMFGPGVFNVPKNATNTIYVEGIRCDATEREVSRKFKCSSCLINCNLFFRHIPPLQRIQVSPVDSQRERSRREGDPLLCRFRECLTDHNSYQYTSGLQVWQRRYLGTSILVCQQADKRNRWVEQTKRRKNHQHSQRQQQKSFRMSHSIWVLDIDTLCDCIFSSLAIPHLG